MSILEFNFYHDAGHGWLEVPLEIINEYGIGEAISSYSYTGNGRVYLEEDCDAAILLNELDKRAIAWKTNPIYHEDSYIRGYRRWAAKAA